MCYISPFRPCLDGPLSKFPRGGWAVGYIWMSSSDICIFSLCVFREEINSNMVVDWWLSEDAVFFKLMLLSTFTLPTSETLTYTLLLILSYFLTPCRAYIGHERMLIHAGFFLTSLTVVQLTPGVQIKMGMSSLYDYFSHSHSPTNHAHIDVSVSVYQPTIRFNAIPYAYEPGEVDKGGSPRESLEPVMFDVIDLEEEYG